MAFLFRLVFPSDLFGLAGVVLGMGGPVLDPCGGPELDPCGGGPVSSPPSVVSLGVVVSLSSSPSSSSLLGEGAGPFLGCTMICLGSSSNKVGASCFSTVLPSLKYSVN